MKDLSVREDKIKGRRCEDVKCKLMAGICDESNGPSDSVTSQNLVFR
jgi:hypothetical protein